MNEIELNVDGKIYRLTNMNNGRKYDQAVKDAGPNATTGQILAHYDKHGGYIQDKGSNKVENGKFWEAEKARIADEPRQLKHKTSEELMEIMRNSIDNQHIPSSVYHRAKQELEFRKIQKQEDEKEDILKISPEFYGMGINLKSLWKKIRSWFQI